MHTRAHCYVNCEMKLLPCHLREAVHTFTTKGLSDELPITLSFDGVHAAIELDKEEWQSAIDWKYNPDTFEESSLLSSHDGAFVHDKVQHTVYVNLAKCDAKGLQINLSMTAPRETRHIILHDPANNRSVHAIPALRVLLAHLAKHVTLPFSFELRGQVMQDRLDELSVYPSFLTHVKIQDSVSIARSISTICKWANSNKHNNLQCLMLDGHPKYNAAPDDAFRQCRALVTEAFHWLARDLTPATLKHSLTIRSFHCVSEMFDGYEAALEKIVKQLGETDLILERCNIKRRQAVMLESLSAHNNVFVHHNAPEPHGVFVPHDPLQHFVTYHYPNAYYDNDTYRSVSGMSTDVWVMKELDRLTRPSE